MIALKRFKVNTTTKQIFTVMVLVMWATSFLMSLANKNYDPPEYVNPLIMLVGGYLLAKQATDKED